MKELRLVHPNPLKTALPAGSGVSIDFELKNGTLIARFDVRYPGTNVNPALAKGDPQWGLWDWDVVELFLECGRESDGSYLEFQVSPLGQHFELKIFEPRKRFDRDFRSGFQHEAKQVSEGHWQAEMRIPFKGNRPRGNAFAILGPEGAKTYWSLFLGPQEIPDFHLPERFSELPIRGPEPARS